MAEIVGTLREDATYGEKQVRKFLGQNLPKDFTVYVETPIRKKRDILYPDFIILTNYGVIVLEVKDWISVERADPDGALIRTRGGETRRMPNPVNTARNYALALDNEVNSRLHSGQPGEAIPWSYAAVLPNLPASVVTRLGAVWGEEFVLGKDDLDIPDLLLQRIKNTFPAARLRPLKKLELDMVRATIFPVVEIEIENRPAVILDEQQEKIVAEPLRAEPQPVSRAVRRAGEASRQADLFDTLKQETGSETPQEELPPEAEQISRNVSLRLVRGFSGSGKTLVLTQRAHYLAALYPEWKIAVLTYNRLLQRQLEQTFKGTSIAPRTFHSLCASWVDAPEAKETKLDSWLRDNTLLHPVIRKLGSDTVCREINWMRDVGISSREQYLGMERRGIGRDLRLLPAERGALYDLLEAYRAYLYKNGLWDWGEIPLLALQAFEQGGRSPEPYDALLIDEAQDWAPVWFRVVNRLVNAEHGLVFLADDPSQSIYRYFSWKEKGISVAGRTRWLRVPYRNTYEIYRAAYGIIADQAEIQKSLSEEGEIIKPELSNQAMRHGQAPLVRKCRSADDELLYMKSTVQALLQEGFPEREITVLARHHRHLERIQNALRGSRVEAHMIHGFKGLEMEAVIIPHLQDTFQKAEDEGGERRLMYMAMSRSRSRLYLTYSGRLPAAYGELRRQGLADFIE